MTRDERWELSMPSTTRQRWSHRTSRPQGVRMRRSRLFLASTGWRRTHEPCTSASSPRARRKCALSTAQQKRPALQTTASLARGYTRKDESYGTADALVGCSTVDQTVIRGSSPHDADSSGSYLGLEARIRT